MEDTGKTCNYFPCWNSVNKSECHNKNKHSWRTHNADIYNIENPVAKIH